MHYAEKVAVMAWFIAGGLVVTFTGAVWYVWIIVCQGIYVVYAVPATWRTARHGKSDRNSDRRAFSGNQNW